jgi:hypothetical protein
MNQCRNRIFEGNYLLTHEQNEYIKKLEEALLLSQILPVNRTYADRFIINEALNAIKK